MVTGSNARPLAPKPDASAASLAMSIIVTLYCPFCAHHPSYQTHHSTGLDRDHLLQRQRALPQAVNYSVPHLPAHPGIVFPLCNSQLLTNITDAQFD